MTLEELIAALRALEAQWREEHRAYLAAPKDYTDIEFGKARAAKRCADDLAALLARLEGT